MRLKPTSNFIVANQDVQSGDVIEILDEGEYEDSERFEGEQLIFTVKVPSGQEKKLSMNGTSQKNLVKAFCPKEEVKDGIMDSKHFVGQEIMVEIKREQVFDKMRDVIYLHPAEDSSSQANTSASQDIPDEVY